MTDASKIQLETSLDTRPVKQGLQEIVQAAEGAAAGVQNAGAKSGKAFDGIGAGADAAAKKVESAERSMVAAIQRRTAAIESAGQSESKYYETLAKQRGVNTDALRPYLQQLDAAKARQDAATASLGNMGLSAKQTAAALRGVPAQFTDIVTSLASGQQPLTVLLQQGGQLKDMFGGAGNAARALGGYVAGLVNPFTLAAGALAAIAAAAYQGTSELQNFNKTLILSGGQAGVSGDQLMSMAAGIDAISGSITQSKAAEALDQIVQAGVRGEQQIKRYALAAAEFEAAGGGAAAEVAKQFAELGKDPLQASVKLTQSMGYLTAETYKQIKALEDQGRTLEAARVAQDAYASALEGKTPALLQNLGLIERSWNAVKNGAKEAWDAMLNVGRADTLSDQVAAVEKRLAAARANPLIGSGNAQATGRRRQAEDELLLDSLREQQRLAARAADMQAARAASEKARISWMQEGDKYLTKEAQMEREIAKIKAQGLAAGASELEIEKRIAALREKNATKPRTSRTREGDPFASERTAAAEWAKYLEQFTDITADAEGKVLGLSKGQAKLVEYLQSPAYKNASEPMRELALQQAYAAIAAEQLSKDMKLQEDQRIKSIAQENEWLKKQQDRIQAIQETARQQRDAAEEIGVEGQALINLRYERELSRAARKEEDAAMMESFGFREETINMVKEEAKAIREAAEASKAYSEKKAFNDYWNDVNRTAESVFMDIAMNGEDAFKRIGESIKREVIQLLYEMTIKKWIFQIAGVSGGVGGGGMDWTSLATKAYEYYAGSSSASTAAISAGAGTVNTTTLSGVGAASAGSTGVAGGSVAASSGTASSTMTSGGFTGYGYLGYAALIAAAVMIAENLYAKGYNRTAVGKGPGETNRFGYTTFTSDPNMGNSTAYNISPENRSRMIFDSLGMNEKWADILSGTTRMGTLFGRKLGAYGYEANIAGGEAEVGGFARYKGGLFRSNKTVGIEVDERDAAALDAIVEAQIEGTRNMARALGLNAEAIDAYTGSVKVNMKGAETAEEQSKRTAEAMDELQLSLLNAASGGKYTKEEFDKMMEGVRASMERVGITTESLADILLAGMTGRLSQADVGDQLSEVIIGGIYDSIASNYAGMIAQAFTSQIITPIFTALAAGVPISQAISQAAIDNIVATAEQAADALNVIFSNPDFQAAIAGISEAIGGVAGAVGSVRRPSFRAPTKAPNNTAQETAREREQLEKELLTLQGNTVELRRRELAALKPVNRALQEQIWALEDVNNLKDAWTGLTDSIEEEIKRLRGVALGEGDQALAYVQSQFAIATGQARAMDQEAAAKLPDLSSQLADLYLNTATSRSDYQARVNSLAASLEETNRITRSTAGISTEGAQKVKDEATLQQIKLLQQDIAALTATLQENNKSAAVTAAALNKASTPAGLRTVSA